MTVAGSLVNGPDRIEDFYYQSFPPPEERGEMVVQASQHLTAPGPNPLHKKMVLCAGCERPILDRFLLNVLDRAWHAQCVQCTECKANLTDKCFSRDGKLYCRDDFFR